MGRPLVGRGTSCSGSSTRTPRSREDGPVGGVPPGRGKHPQRRGSRFHEGDRHRSTTALDPEGKRVHRDRSGSQASPGDALPYTCRLCSERRRNRTFQPWGCQGLPLLKGVVCREFVVVWASVLRPIRAEGPGVALRLLQPRSRDLDTVLPVPLNRRRSVVAAPALHAGYQYVSAWLTTLRRDSISLMLQPRSCNAPESVPAG
jgi:hypothetical protein